MLGYGFDFGSVFEETLPVISQGAVPSTFVIILQVIEDQAGLWMTPFAGKHSQGGQEAFAFVVRLRLL